MTPSTVATPKPTPTVSQKPVKKHHEKKTVKEDPFIVYDRPATKVYPELPIPQTEGID